MEQTTIREQLDELLKENGLKLNFVADTLDINYNTLSRWKRGRLDYGAEKLNKIIRFINTYKEDK